MIRIRLKEALEVRNKNLKWLSETTGIRYATLHPMYHNKTQRVNLNYIDAIMTALDIEDINELLERVEEDV